jgi:hypothetical protein
MSFTHSKLQGNGLRLLRPISTTQERLDFQLSQFQRQDAPRYTAVSYTWGSEKPTEMIYLNNEVLHVTPNLWSCLYYLGLDQEHQEHQEWDFLWVDAICIDQNNDLERNAQVRDMDATYRDATCVSVWLGLIPIPDFYGTGWPQLHEPIKTIDSDGFEWIESMADIANRPYWSRFWVIQEFLLCQNVNLYCSGNRIDWLIFQEFLERHTGISLHNSNSYGAINNDFEQLPAAFPLVISRHPDRFPELSQPLYDLLVSHRKSQCKDPRDRVFALLGLIPRDERTMLERFFPDYTLSKDNVIVITLGHLIDFSQKSVTLDSEDIFMGLGVQSRTQRGKLLRRLDRFDYIGSDGNTSHLRDLELEEEWELTEGENMDESIGAAQPEASKTGVSPHVGKVVILALFLLGVIVWSKGK